MLVRIASAAVLVTMSALPSFGAPPDVGNWVKRTYYLECRIEADSSGRFNPSAVILNRTSLHFRPGTRIDVTYHTTQRYPYQRPRRVTSFTYVGNRGLGAGASIRLGAEGPGWANRCAAMVTVPNASRTPPRFTH